VREVDKRRILRGALLGNLGSWLQGLERRAVSPLFWPGANVGHSGSASFVLRPETRPRRFTFLEFVGLSFKEKVVEFFLGLSGILFYHLILRPLEYIRLRKKNKNSKPTEEVT
jgi:hypothetical protein